jgi:hypothetical protein
LSLVSSSFLFPLFFVFSSDYQESEEKLLHQKIVYFQDRTQEQWGVPTELISPLGWKTAIFVLSSLETNLTPSIQLQILIRTVKAIYSEFKFAVLPILKEQGKSEVFIAADDLVPIFIYVFCQTKLNHPILDRDIMWGLCHPDSLHGEGGYYLTVYESAIEYILNEPSEREAFLGKTETSLV